MATRMDRHKSENNQQNSQISEGESLKRQRDYQEQPSKNKNHNDKGSKKKRKKIWYVLGIILLLILLFLGKIYLDARQTVSNMQDQVSTSDVNLKESESDVKDKKPISILLLGSDDGALGRANSGGRSDTMMILTLNPSKKSGMMVSLERDSYVEIANQGTKDKLNSAYTYGVGTAIQTVEQLVDIPIDFYAAINMEGLEQLVDAVGGVTVESNLSFTYEGYTFVKGENKIEDGKEALAFTRMRKEDPEGDYGRQRRQRALVNAIIQKVGSVSSLTHYKEILTTVQDNMKTDMNWSTMMSLATKYRSCFDNIESDYLKGTGFMQNGISYQDISSDLPRIQEELSKSLEE